MAPIPASLLRLFGPLEPLLADPTVTRLFVEGPRRVLVERGTRSESVDVGLTADALEHALEGLAARAGKRFDAQRPCLEALLKDGTRFLALRAPVVSDGPVLAVRRPGGTSRDLHELVLAGLDAEVAEALAVAIAAGLNVVVAGGDSGARRELLVALTVALPQRARLAVLCDGGTLPLPGHEPLILTPLRSEGDEGRGVSGGDLLYSAGRLGLDRVLVPELKMADAWDAVALLASRAAPVALSAPGHTAADALLRLESMARASAAGARDRAVPGFIASGVDLVVTVGRSAEALVGLDSVLPEAGRGVAHSLLDEREALSAEGRLAVRRWSRLLGPGERSALHAVVNVTPTVFHRAGALEEASDVAAPSEAAGVDSARWPAEEQTAAGSQPADERREGGQLAPGLSPPRAPHGADGEPQSGQIPGLAWTEAPRPPDANPANDEGIGPTPVPGDLKLDDLEDGDAASVEALAEVPKLSASDAVGDVSARGVPQIVAGTEPVGLAGIGAEPVAVESVGAGSAGAELAGAGPEAAAEADSDAVDSGEGDVRSGAASTPDAARAGSGWSEAGPGEAGPVEAGPMEAEVSENGEGSPGVAPATEEEVLVAAGSLELPPEVEPRHSTNRAGGLSTLVPLRGRAVGADREPDARRVERLSTPAPRDPGPVEIDAPSAPLPSLRPPEPTRAGPGTVDQDDGIDVDIDLAEIGVAPRGAGVGPRDLTGSEAEGGAPQARALPAPDDGVAEAVEPDEGGGFERQFTAVDAHVEPRRWVEPGEATPTAGPSAGAVGAAGAHVAAQDEGALGQVAGPSSAHVAPSVDAMTPPLRGAAVIRPARRVTAIELAADVPLEGDPESLDADDGRDADDDDLDPDEIETLGSAAAFGPPPSPVSVTEDVDIEETATFAAMRFAVGVDAPVGRAGGPVSAPRPRAPSAGPQPMRSPSSAPKPFPSGVGAEPRGEAKASDSGSDAGRPPAEDSSFDISVQLGEEDVIEEESLRPVIIPGLAAPQTAGTNDVTQALDALRDTENSEVTAARDVIIDPVSVASPSPGDAEGDPLRRLLHALTDDDDSLAGALGSDEDDDEDEEQVTMITGFAVSPGDITGEILSPKTFSQILRTLGGVGESSEMPVVRPGAARADESRTAESPAQRTPGPAPRGRRPGDRNTVVHNKDEK